MGKFLQGFINFCGFNLMNIFEAIFSQCIGEDSLHIYNANNIILFHYIEGSKKALGDKSVEILNMIQLATYLGLN